MHGMQDRRSWNTYRSAAACDEWRLSVKGVPEARTVTYGNVHVVDANELRSDRRCAQQIVEMFYALLQRLY